MTGITLKGQADLNSIIVPLDGAVITNNERKEIVWYCSCFQYKTRFIRPNRLRKMMKGLCISIRLLCQLPLFVYFGKTIFFDLMFECIRIEVRIRICISSNEISSIQQFP